MSCTVVCVYLVCILSTVESEDTFILGDYFQVNMVSGRNEGLGATQRKQIKQKNQRVQINILQDPKIIPVNFHKKNVESLSWYFEFKKCAAHAHNSGVVRLFHLSQGVVG